METSKVSELISSGINSVHVEVKDTTDTGDHFSAIVISSSFDGLSLIEQHQKVYSAIGDHMTKEIHALQLKTFSTKEWEKNNPQEN